MSTADPDNYVAFLQDTGKTMSSHTLMNLQWSASLLSLPAPLESPIQGTVVFCSRILDLAGTSSLQNPGQ
jgi:hypothetical protein